MARCAICGQREATKPNSHLIPSFIISMVSSYDGSYKRDKEMLFLLNQFRILFMRDAVLQSLNFAIITTQ